MSDPTVIAAREYRRASDGASVWAQIFTPEPMSDGPDWLCRFRLAAMDDTEVESLSAAGIDAMQALGLAIAMLDARIESDVALIAVNGIPNRIFPAGTKT